MLGGNLHVGGIDTGILDALSRGILKETGYYGRQHATRETRLHALLDQARGSAIEAFAKEFGAPPATGEIAAEATLALAEVFRAYVDDEYGEEYRAAASRATQAAQAGKAEEASRDEDARSSMYQ
jgi:hypothetical protein